MNKIAEIKNEVAKAVQGKDEVIEKVLIAILAGGHILMEDIPGVGKTTLALAFSKALGLSYGRVQCTPDVMPTDITGFEMYSKEKEEFVYKPGAAMCNFLLADEINRTSSKTQSALLEVMQEGKISVDGKSREVPKPFIVMATENPIGSAGTQRLPEAQLDRFMMKLGMGYPDKAAQIEMLKKRRAKDPLEDISAVTSAAELCEMMNEVKNIHTDEKIYEYITELTEVSRGSKYTTLGISPRGALALSDAARALAYVKGRSYAVPQDVRDVFADVCGHRILISSEAKLAGMDAAGVLEEFLKITEEPIAG